MRVTTARRRAPLAAVSVLLLLAQACASSAPEAPESPLAPAEEIQPLQVSPTLWSVRGPNDAGRLYLLGSIHLGRAGVLDLGPAVERAYRASDEIVVEVDLSQLGKEESLELARRYGMYEPPATLKDNVSRDTWRALDGYLLGHGISIKTFELFRPWLAATTVSVIEFRGLGFDPDFGVDRVFIDRSQGRKPIAALETPDSQFGLLAGLPDDVQEEMLREVLDRVDEFQQDAIGMVTAWQQGDDTTLEKIVFRSLREDPGYAVFYERVLFERNRRMTERLAELAADGRTRFVVVGAAHLLGDRGMLAEFATRGYEVEKVD
jgi:uncharacterized protein YbaP (TraB family)